MCVHTREIKWKDGGWGQGWESGEEQGGYGTDVEFLSGKSQVDWKIGRRERKILSGMVFIRMGPVLAAMEQNEVLVHRGLVSTHCQCTSSIMHLLKDDLLKVKTKEISPDGYQSTNY